MVDQLPGDAPQDGPQSLSDVIQGAIAGGQSDDAKMMDRERPEPPEARAALVKKLLKQIAAGEKRWEKAFKRMAEWSDFVLGLQWEGQHSIEDRRYIANIVQRHVKLSVATLYAKNPKFVARARQVMDFAAWDEKVASFKAAIAAAQIGDPSAADLIQDIVQGMQKRQMRQRVARTLEIVHDYYVQEQDPPFKRSMKQLVRRAVTHGIGWVKVCYQRETGRRPEDAAKIADMEQQLATIERLNADIADGEVPEDAPETEELRLALQTLQSQPEVIVREGLFYDFPQANMIIPDPKCRSLDGFIGANWVAQKYLLSVDAVKEIYKIDVGTNYTSYCLEPDGNHTARSDGEQDVKRDEDLVCVYEMFNKADGTVYVMAVGYPDFLVEPYAPDVKLSRFYPWFGYMLNEVENEKEIFPLSDVHLLKPMQREYNRARESLREHRRAARPKYASPRGRLSDEDKSLLKTSPAHAVIELDGLESNEDVGKVLQPIKTHGIDPNLYDTSYVFDDAQRVSGSQEANLGGTSGSTATESSIAETSRAGVTQSNSDDLDDFLTDIARASGQVLLGEVDAETVAEIAGPGSSWPELSTKEIQKEIDLEIEAGSSGRPNKAMEIQNWQLMLPQLMQIPGIDPAWLLRETVKRLDDRLDVTDAMAESYPSVSALNALVAKGAGMAGLAGVPGAPSPAGALGGAAGAAGAQPTGDHQTDPHMQGSAGGMNAPQPAMPRPAPAAAPPAPGPTGPIAR